MRYYRKTIANTAERYTGIKEGSEEHKAVLNVYNNHRPLPRGYKAKLTDSWCAIFASAVAIMCGYSDIIPVECSCAQMVELAKQKGIWKESDEYVPSIGDLVLYDWQDTGVGDNVGHPDHVGIVIHSRTNGTFEVVEGNYNNAVGHRVMSVNGKFIRGFIAPKYTALSEGAVIQSLTGEKIVTANSLNIRTKPSSNAPILSQIKKGQVITVSEVSGQWSKIEAWVSNNYLKPYTYEG